MNVMLRKILEHVKEVVYVEQHVEPFLDFMAEYQDWREIDGTEKLLIGYHFVENGDICFDPLFSFVIQDGEVKQIVYSSWIGTTLNVTKDPYSYAFVDTVWHRHFTKGVDPMLPLAEETAGLPNS